MAGDEKPAYAFPFITFIDWAQEMCEKREKQNAIKGFLLYSAGFEDFAYLLS